MMNEREFFANCIERPFHTYSRTGTRAEIHWILRYLRTHNGGRIARFLDYWDDKVCGESFYVANNHARARRVEWLNRAVALMAARGDYVALAQSIDEQRSHTWAGRMVEQLTLDERVACRSAGFIARVLSVVILHNGTRQPVAKDRAVSDTIAAIDPSICWATDSMVWRLLDAACAAGLVDELDDQTIQTHVTTN